MSDIPYTVLISPAGVHPWGDRRLKPTAFASLSVGGSAIWSFTAIIDGAMGSVRPYSPDEVAGALLVGIATHIIKDDHAIRLWDDWTKSGKNEVRRKRDAALIAHAKTVAAVTRLTVVTETDAAELTDSPDMRGVDIEVLTPSRAE